MSLLFTDYHIDLIREEEKVATRRSWADNYAAPTVGSIQMAVEKPFQTDIDCDTYVVVTDVYQEPLGAMSEEDAEMEGGYTLEEFKDVWAEIDGEWDPDKSVYVIEFQYGGESRGQAREIQEKLGFDKR